jgi:chromosome segregation ATPase
MNVHTNSPLGKATAAAAALEAQRDQAAQLVEQREAELAKADQDLRAVPADVKDLREVIKVLGRQAGLGYLLGLARDETQRRAQELDRTTGQIANLQQRLARLEAGVKSLEDNTKILPYSPVERTEKLLVGRYRLAALAGDPDELPHLLQEIEDNIDEDRWVDLRLELEGHARDVAALCEAVEWYSVRVKADNPLRNITVDGRPFTQFPAYLRGDELTSGIRRAPALIVEPVEGPQD